VLYEKSEDSHDINLTITVILTIIVNLTLKRKVIQKRDERFEIEVIACYPECGHSYSDWILFKVECPLIFKDSDGRCKKVEGKIDVE